MNLTMPINMAAQACTTGEQCFSWCKAQHFAHNYGFMWLLIPAFLCVSGAAYCKWKGYEEAGLLCLEAATVLMAATFGWVLAQR